MSTLSTVLKDLTTVVNLNDEIFTTLNVNGKMVCVKLDTGAKCNVLPHTLVGNMNVNKHRRANLIAFGGSEILTEGVVTVKVNGLDVEFQVVNKGMKPLLGLRACLQLGLISFSPKVFEIYKQSTVIDALSQYPDLFDDRVGELPVTNTMTIDNTGPVVRPPRRVSAAMQDRNLIEW